MQKIFKTKNSKALAPQIWLHVDIIWKTVKYTKSQSHPQRFSGCKEQGGTGILKDLQAILTCSEVGETYSRWCYSLPSREQSKSEAYFSHIQH